MVVGIDGDGADGLHWLLVEHRLEAGAAVLGLPHAARRGADVKSELAAGFIDRGHGGDAAAHGGRADVAGAQARQRASVEALRGGRGRLVRGGGAACRQGRGEGETEGSNEHGVSPHFAAVAGKANWLSSMGALAVAFSTTILAFCVEPFGPKDKLKGRYTPSTCS